MKLWFWIFGWFLCILTMVVNRYIVMMKPLRYLTFIKRRLVIQMVFTSWGIPFFFHSYFFFTVSYTQIIRTCDDHRRLFVFAFRDNNNNNN